MSKEYFLSVELCSETLGDKYSYTNFSSSNITKSEKTYEYMISITIQSANSKYKVSDFKLNRVYAFNPV